MTKSERKLWYEFLKNYKLPFQRQKTIDHYIVDFYCAKAKLVIEIDGGGHYNPEQREYDEERTKTLGKYNLKVLRFSNTDILKNFYGTCTIIDNEIKSRAKISPSVTA
ncbi:MAG: endonuclease domain-containing protein [Clostridia bacterium]|nr:endonuclease domain-containing protein [Clostridia bacterium]